MPVARANEFTGPDLEMDEFYTVRIKSVEDVENKYGPDPRVLATYQVLDENGKPSRDDDGLAIEVQDGITVTAKAGSKSKFNQIWNAIFYDGKGVPEDTEMDTDELPGKRMRIMWGMVTNPNDKTQRPGIVRYSPTKKVASKRDLEDEIDDI